MSALDSIRDRLDALDGRLVDLLAERAALAAEAAEAKARGGLPLYDRAREAELLEGVERRAAARGLPPGLAGDVLRRLLAESTRVQADWNRRRGAGGAPRRIAIVGGTGGMGRLFHRFFRDLGHEVLAAGLDTALRPVEAAARADVVVVSVPIEATEAVIGEVGPAVREGGLLCDLTSVKGAPVRAMLGAAPGADVVGMHPMFGPMVRSLRGQTVVLCPGRGEAGLGWLRAALSSQGAVVKVTDPETHDRMMSVVQVLTHFSTIALGTALRRLGVDVPESLSFTSPIYRLELTMVGRLFAQDAGLYAEIEMRNPETPRVIGALRESADRLAELVAAGDRAGFVSEFRETARWLGPFTARALAESAALMDWLTSRPGSP
ncbi:MAG: bifunctional chorismate mutase/prephenate dehydrogenase [Planctomycetales bacterium]|nr:bifunctional chorismate mutase/prephenate dehydrogenase [Planctomycetales bacterium]